MTYNYGKKADKQNRLCSEVSMNLIEHPWKPGLNFNKNNDFNYEAFEDGKKWYIKGLSKEDIEKYINLGKQNKDYIITICNNIRKNNDINNKEQETLDDSFEIMLLTENLIDKKYQNAFIVGWDFAERSFLAENQKKNVR